MCFWVFPAALSARALLSAVVYISLLNIASAKYIANAVAFILFFVLKHRKWAARASGEGLGSVGAESGLSRHFCGDLKTPEDTKYHG